jgi:hypothetical protein
MQSTLGALQIFLQARDKIKVISNLFAKTVKLHDLDWKDTWVFPSSAPNSALRCYSPSQSSFNLTNYWPQIWQKNILAINNNIIYFQMLKTSNLIPSV